MTLPPPKEVNIIRRAWHFLTQGWAEQVPNDVACCEFQCKRTQCLDEEWETCQRRLDYVEKLESKAPASCCCDTSVSADLPSDSNPASRH